MWRARRNQRDLFDEKPPVAELSPELRSRLAMLLQALLSEAGHRRTADRFDGSRRRGGL